ncbi:sigma-70 family RNA polymerase sigma factor [Mycobacterium sp. Y57]|uniref:sigma-70 family RNA polymerase sigma factor n=1 Tax=Mycolicibacterium xanthum TaxID=2796469 RepID=UPI001C84CB68|nr:sigma-70 family RNA polymerase sigma factor [Mycolicibacterium xanthum]MBX7434207.1 sigma-70 family RNA polymerase sigma factor [Mycolicibacterium xanthum]
MTDTTVADLWHQHRKRVLDVSYRMLGTLTDAEDALQETFARLTRSDVDAIDDVEGWLVTVAGRVCLDMLRAGATRRRYLGPWLPEPLIDQYASAPDPADRVTLDDTVRIALLAVLHTLSPAERVAFVLHDVFGLTFEAIGEIVGRSPAATRKLASRARTAIRDDPEPRFDVTTAQARSVAERFAAACAGGDIADLAAVLAPDVVGEFDSGGRVAGAPHDARVGAELVSIVLAGSLFGAGADFRVAGVNGRPGVVVSLRGRVMAVIDLETDGHRVLAIRAIGNPEKLARLNRG